MCKHVHVAYISVLALNMWHHVFATGMRMIQQKESCTNIIYFGIRPRKPIKLEQTGSH